MLRTDKLRKIGANWVLVDVGYAMTCLFAGRVFNDSAEKAYNFYRLQGHNDRYGTEENNKWDNQR